MRGKRLELRLPARRRRSGDQCWWHCRRWTMDGSTGGRVVVLHSAAEVSLSPNLSPHCPRLLIIALFNLSNRTAQYRAQLSKHSSPYAESILPRPLQKTAISCVCYSSFFLCPSSNAANLLALPQTVDDLPSHQPLRFSSFSYF
jgi:hypothetical protein